MEEQLAAPRQQGRGRRKYLKPALALAFLIGSVLAGNAWADRGGHHGHHGHHGRGHVGVFIGAPLFWGPGWYADPYYGYPYRYRPVLVAPEPPVYIERDVAPATALWYFCSNPQGYYPYVKQCSTSWRTVTPQSVGR